MLERFLFCAKMVALCRKAHINPRQSDMVKIESKAPLGSLVGYFSLICALKIRSGTESVYCVVC